MVLRDHPRVKKKLHDLETSSLITKKKKIEIEPVGKKKAVFWDCEGLLLCEFLPQKQQSTATNTAKLSKNCAKPLNERDQDD
jgi:hypothetical protein